MHPKAIVLMFFLLESTAVIAESDEDKHTFRLGFRPRLAMVERPEKVGEDGRSASVLIRINLQSEWNDYFSSEVELDYVATAWNSEFSNGVDFDDKPFIPDVPGAEINQAFVRYSLSSSVQLDVGRKTINIGNQRFVGANGFWQNAQSFDTAGMEVKIATSSRISYAYVNNANRIFGDKSPTLPWPGYDVSARGGPNQVAGDHEHQTHLVNSEFREWDYSQLQAYYLDINDLDAPVVRNRTAGLRYSFERNISGIKPHVDVEVAQQRRKSVTQPLMYYRLDAGAGYKFLKMAYRYEQLNSRSDGGIVTPLGSLHDFGGWGDKFSALPQGGLKDHSLQFVWRKKPWKLDVRYHEFYSENSEEHYGGELDVDLSFRIKHKNTVQLRYSNFKAASESSEAFSDESRIYLNYSYNL